VIAGPSVAAAVAAVVAAQIALLMDQQPHPSAALDVALRVGAGTWALLTLLSVALDMVSQPRASGTTDSSRDGLGAVRAAAVLGALFAIAVQRSPQRAFLNLVGFAALAVPLVWTVQRWRGGASATRAVLALGVLALASARVNLPPNVAFNIAEAKPASPFRWTVGFPSGEWTLRHEFLAGASHPPGYRPELLIPLAAPYAGTSNVVVTLDGKQVTMLEGPARGFLHARLQPEWLALPGPRTLELRLLPPDPQFRLLAQRWTAGASLGPNASSYFDGVAWHSGTFNDLTGLAQPGIYVLQIR
jgi:hypothetical protein